MDLPGLFQRLRAPKKAGTPAPEPMRRPTVERFFLEFANIQDTPRYALEEHFTVGSEIGDLVVDEPSLSPRHATFHLKDGVVTVTDHASARGTQLAGSPLPRGRAVILEVGDEVVLGDVVVKLVSDAVRVPAFPSLPPTEDAPEDVETRVTSDEEEVPELPRHEAAPRPARPKAIGGGKDRAANALPRVIALLLDVAWSVVLWEVFAPFVDFREGLELVPRWLQSEFLPVVEGALASVGLKGGWDFLVRILAEADEGLDLSYLAMLFVLLRVGPTLLWGTSLGSYMAGIRASGNWIGKRLGGVLRELLGLLTGPLLIPDLPTLLSKRSLKEVLTRTLVYTPSRGAVVASLVLFLPLSLVALVAAPLLEGGELAVAVPLSKTAPKEIPAPMPATGELPSPWFGARFRFEADDWWALPRFTWSMRDGTRSLLPALLFQHSDGTSVPLVLARTFAWSDLLAPVMAHNPAARAAYPTLKSVWRGKQRLGASEREAFPRELQRLIDTAFALEASNVLDHVQAHGFPYKGYLDFRRALMGLVASSPDGIWSVTTMGDTSFLFYGSSGERPHDTFIPLLPGKGRVLRVSYPSGRARARIHPRAEAGIWGRTAWSGAGASSSVGMGKIVDVAAALATPGPAPAAVAALEEVYGSFYEAASATVGSPVESPRRKALLASLADARQVMRQLRGQRARAKDVEAAAELDRLAARLTELHAQLKAGNLAFFGYESTAPAETPPPEAAPAPTRDL